MEDIQPKKKKKLNRSPTHHSLTPKAQEGGASSKNHGNHLETQQKKQDSSSVTECYPSTNFPSEMVQALEDQQNRTINHKATLQLQRLLSGTRYSSNIALEFLPRLSREDKVLLACTTIVDREVTPYATGYWEPESWTINERENFCLKFSSSMRGKWCMNDILCRYVNLFKVGHRTTYITA